MHDRKHESTLYNESYRAIPCGNGAEHLKLVINVYCGLDYFPLSNEFRAVYFVNIVEDFTPRDPLSMQPFFN